MRAFAVVVWKRWEKFHFSHSSNSLDTRKRLRKIQAKKSAFSSFWLFVVSHRTAFTEEKSKFSCELSEISILEPQQTRFWNCNLFYENNIIFRCINPRLTVKKFALNLLPPFFLPFSLHQSSIVYECSSTAN